MIVVTVVVNSSDSSSDSNICSAFVGFFKVNAIYKK